MFLGLTLANILGVPLGTLVGQNFGWRATFGLITALGLVALVPVYLLVPESRRSHPAACAASFRCCAEFDVLLAIATTVLSSAAVFTLFTYIVPLLQDLTGFAPANVTLILFMIGIGLTIGITLGGKFSDRARDARDDRHARGARARRSLVLPLVIHSKVATLVVVFLWAMAAFGLVPGLQSRVVDKAQRRPEPRLHAEHRRLQPRQRRRRLPGRRRHRPGLGPPCRAGRRRPRRRCSASPPQFSAPRAIDDRRAALNGLTSTTTRDRRSALKCDTKALPDTARRT